MYQLHAPLHYILSHVLATCDRPSLTVLMSANSDICGVQQGLFENRSLRAAVHLHRQDVGCSFCVVDGDSAHEYAWCIDNYQELRMRTPTHVLFAVQLKSLSLGRDLHLPENLSFILELDAMPLNGASTKYIYNIFTYLQEA
jgi:hypothetical protein